VSRMKSERQLLTLVQTLANGNGPDPGRDRAASGQRGHGPELDVSRVSRPVCRPIAALFAGQDPGVDPGATSRYRRAKNGR
jgi:hypothetical protein